MFLHLVMQTLPELFEKHNLVWNNYSGNPLERNPLERWTHYNEGILWLPKFRGGRGFDHFASDQNLRCSACSMLKKKINSSKLIHRLIRQSFTPFPRWLPVWLITSINWLTLFDKYKLSWLQQAWSLLPNCVTLEWIVTCYLDLSHPFRAKHTISNK